MGEQMDLFGGAVAITTAPKAKTRKPRPTQYALFAADEAVAERPADEQFTGKFDLTSAAAGYDEAEDDGPATATVSVWTFPAGEYGTLLHRETVELAEDTDAAAQSHADAVLAAHPAADVAVRVLVGRDNAPHTYAIADRSA